LALLNFKNKVGDIMNVVEGLKTIDQIIDKMCDKDEQRDQYNKLHLIILEAIEIINKQ
jgi:CRISPR/Cas system CSM-associated protein Csm2 small subunit